MKKFIAKAVGCILAAVSICSMAACSTGETVTIGYTDYAPMNYKDEKGKLVGFDTELAKAVFKELIHKMLAFLDSYAEKNTCNSTNN